jgi:Protein of unknown function (DUF2796)
VKFATALAVFAAIAVVPAAAQERRELGAHEHGRGALNIAIEGNKVTMELEVPGMDIVGFEHAAKTRRDTAALEKAKGQLAAPLALFKLPAAAGCRVTDSKVAVEKGEHDHDGKEAAAKGTEDDKEAKGEGHSEFHAEYTLECASAHNITAIEFGYFRAFAGAEKLDVNVITANGQSKLEATRAKPSISLAGMM